MVAGMLNMRTCCLTAGILSRMSRHLSEYGCATTFCQRHFRTSGTTNTHYDTLGISKSATQAEVKEAYIKLCKEYHPDTHSNDEHKGKKFLKVNDAYTTLSNMESRREYDARLSFRGPSDDFGRWSSAYENHPYARQRRRWEEGQSMNSQYSQRPEYGSNRYRRDSQYQYWDNFYKNKRANRTGERTNVNFDPNFVPASQAVRVFLLFVFLLLVTRYYVSMQSKRYRLAMEEMEILRHNEVKQRAAEALDRRQKYEEYLQSKNKVGFSETKLEDA